MLEPEDTTIDMRKMRDGISDKFEAFIAARPMTTSSGKRSRKNNKSKSPDESMLSNFHGGHQGGGVANRDQEGRESSSFYKAYNDAHRSTPAQQQDYTAYNAAHRIERMNFASKLLSDIGHLVEHEQQELHGGSSSNFGLQEHEQRGNAHVLDEGAYFARDLLHAQGDLPAAAARPGTAAAVPSSRPSYAMKPDHGSGGGATVDDPDPSMMLGVDQMKAERLARSNKEKKEGIPEIPISHEIKLKQHISSPTTRAAEYAEELEFVRRQAEIDHRNVVNSEEWRRQHGDLLVADQENRSKSAAERRVEVEEQRWRNSTLSPELRTGPPMLTAEQLKMQKLLEVVDDPSLSPNSRSRMRSTNSYSKEMERHLKMQHYLSSGGDGGEVEEHLEAGHQHQHGAPHQKQHRLLPSASTPSSSSASPSPHLSRKVRPRPSSVLSPLDNSNFYGQQNYSSDNNFASSPGGASSASSLSAAPSSSLSPVTNRGGAHQPSPQHHVRRVPPSPSFLGSVREENAEELLAAADVENYVEAEELLAAADVENYVEAVENYVEADVENYLAAADVENYVEAEERRKRTELLAAADVENYVEAVERRKRTEKMNEDTNERKATLDRLNAKVKNDAEKFKQRLEDVFGKDNERRNKLSTGTSGAAASSSHGHNSHTATHQSSLQSTLGPDAAPRPASPGVRARQEELHEKLAQLTNRPSTEHLIPTSLAVDPSASEVDRLSAHLRAGLSFDRMQMVATILSAEPSASSSTFHSSSSGNEEDSRGKSKTEAGAKGTKTQVIKNKGHFSKSAVNEKAKMLAEEHAHHQAGAGQDEQALPAAEISVERQNPVATSDSEHHMMQSDVTVEIELPPAAGEADQQELRQGVGVAKRSEHQHWPVEANQEQTVAAADASNYNDVVEDESSSSRRSSSQINQQSQQVHDTTDDWSSVPLEVSTKRRTSQEEEILRENVLQQTACSVVDQLPLQSDQVDQVDHEIDADERSLIETQNRNPTELAQKINDRLEQASKSTSSLGTSKSSTVVGDQHMAASSQHQMQNNHGPAGAQEQLHSDVEPQSDSTVVPVEVELVGKAAEVGIGAVVQKKLAVERVASGKDDGAAGSSVEQAGTKTASSVLSGSRSALEPDDAQAQASRVDEQDEQLLLAENNVDLVEEGDLLPFPFQAGVEKEGFRIGNNNRHQDPEFFDPDNAPPLRPELVKDNNFFAKYVDTGIQTSKTPTIWSSSASEQGRSTGGSSSHNLYQQHERHRQAQLNTDHVHHDNHPHRSRSKTRNESKNNNSPLSPMLGGGVGANQNQFRTRRSPSNRRVFDRLFSDAEKLHKKRVLEYTKEKQKHVNEWDDRVDHSPSPRARNRNASPARGRDNGPHQRSDADGYLDPVPDSEYVPLQRPGYRPPTTKWNVSQKYNGSWNEVDVDLWMESVVDSPPGRNRGNVNDYYEPSVNMHAKNMPNIIPSPDTGHHKKRPKTSGVVGAASAIAAGSGLFLPPGNMKNKQQRPRSQSPRKSKGTKSRKGSATDDQEVEELGGRKPMFRLVIAGTENNDGGTTGTDAVAGSSLLNNRRGGTGAPAQQAQQPVKNVQALARARQSGQNSDSLVLQGTELERYQKWREKQNLLQQRKEKQQKIFEKKMQQIHSPRNYGAGPSGQVEPGRLGSNDIEYSNPGALGLSPQNYQPLNLDGDWVSQHDKDVFLNAKHPTALMKKRYLLALKKEEEQRELMLARNREVDPKLEKLFQPEKLHSKFRKPYLGQELEIQREIEEAKQRKELEKEKAAELYRKLWLGGKKKEAENNKSESPKEENVKKPEPVVERKIEPVKMPDPPAQKKWIDAQPKQAVKQNKPAAKVAVAGTAPKKKGGKNKQQSTQEQYESIDQVIQNANRRMPEANEDEGLLHRDITGPGTWKPIPADKPDYKQYQEGLKQAKAELAPSLTDKLHANHVYPTISEEELQQRALERAAEGRKERWEAKVMQERNAAEADAAAAEEAKMRRGLVRGQQPPPAAASSTTAVAASSGSSAATRGKMLRGEAEQVPPGTTFVPHQHQAPPNPNTKNHQHDGAHLQQPPKKASSSKRPASAQAHVSQNAGGAAPGAVTAYRHAKEQEARAAAGVVQTSKRAAVGPPPSPGGGAHTTAVARHQQQQSPAQVLVSAHQIQHERNNQPPNSPPQTGRTSTVRTQIVDSRTSTVLTTTANNKVATTRAASPGGAAGVAPGAPAGATASDQHPHQHHAVLHNRQQPAVSSSTRGRQQKQNLISTQLKTDERADTRVQRLGLSPIRAGLETNDPSSRKRKASPGDRGGKNCASRFQNRYGMAASPEYLVFNDETSEDHSFFVNDQKLNFSPKGQSNHVMEAKLKQQQHLRHAEMIAKYQEEQHRKARQRLLKAMETAKPGQDEALLRRVDQLMRDMKHISGAASTSAAIAQLQQIHPGNVGKLEKVSHMISPSNGNKKSPMLMNQVPHPPSSSSILLPMPSAAAASAVFPPTSTGSGRTSTGAGVPPASISDGSLSPHKLVEPGGLLSPPARRKQHLKDPLQLPSPLSSDASSPKRGKNKLTPIGGEINMNNSLDNSNSVEVEVEALYDKHSSSSTASPKRLSANPPKILMPISPSTNLPPQSELLDNASTSGYHEQDRIIEEHKKALLLQDHVDSTIQVPPKQRAFVKLDAFGREPEKLYASQLRLEELRNYNLLSHNEKVHLVNQVKALIASRELEGIDRDLNLKAARMYAGFEIDRIFEARSKPPEPQAAAQPAAKSKSKSAGGVAAPTMIKSKASSSNKPGGGPHVISGAGHGAINAAEVEAMVAATQQKLFMTSEEESSAASLSSTAMMENQSRSFEPIPTMGAVAAPGGSVNRGTGGGAGGSTGGGGGSSKVSAASVAAPAPATGGSSSRMQLLHENASALLIQHRWKKKVKALNHLQDANIQRDEDGLFEVG